MRNKLLLAFACFYYCANTYAFSSGMVYCTQNTYDQRWHSRKWGIPLTFLSAVIAGASVAARKEGESLGPSGVIGASIVGVGVLGAAFSAMMTRGPCQVKQSEELNTNPMTLKGYENYDNYLEESRYAYNSARIFYIGSAAVLGAMIFLSKKTSSRIISGTMALVPLGFSLWNYRERKNKSRLFPEEGEISLATAPFFGTNNELGVSLDFRF